jgi:hypothetical protein
MKCVVCSVVAALVFGVWGLTWAVDPSGAYILVAGQNRHHCR